MSTKEIGLAVFGVLILGLWAYLSVTSQSLGMVRSEILSIVGWVAIWEATMFERVTSFPPSRETTAADVSSQELSMANMVMSDS